MHVWAKTSAARASADAGARRDARREAVFASTCTERGVFCSHDMSVRLKVHSADDFPPENHRRRSALKLLLAILDSLFDVTDES